MLRRLILLGTILIFGANPIGGGGGGGGLEVNYFITNYSPIGPFTAHCSDYSLTGSYKSGFYTGRVAERLRVGYIGQSKTYANSKAIHQVYKGTTYDLTFKLPFKDMLNDTGLEVEISFLDSSSTVLQSFFFHIKPYNPERVYPKDYLNTYYSLYDIVVDPDNYSSLSEKYTFNGFIDYFNNDYYYRLNFNSFYLTYQSQFDFTNIECSLHYVDYDHLFPYLDNEDGEFDIPLITTKVGNIISFRLNQVLYVNPKNLDMSYAYIPNFVATNYFYLPVNKMPNLLDSVFELRVNNFGLGKNYFTWNVRYMTNHGLIGDCDSSDYCIIGENV